jgi:hypothetical protein
VEDDRKERKEGTTIEGREDTREKWVDGSYNLFGDRLNTLFSFSSNNTFFAFCIGTFTFP